MVFQEISHALVAMTEKYAKCNIRRLQNDFPPLADRIAFRLISPIEESSLLRSIYKWLKVV